MNNFLPELITVATLHLLAVMSPGPDFVMITRNSLMYSKRTGIFSAVGLGLGILVHVAYSLVGIGLLISKSIVAFSIIKYLGAGYLIYIGIKSLRSKAGQLANEQVEIKQNDLTPWEAIKIGFLTNALNPKATLFFLAVFTQVIDQSTPLYAKLFYGIEMSVMTFVWFSLVSLVFTNSVVKRKFSGVQHYLERATGLILIGLGIKVAISTK